MRARGNSVQDTRSLYTEVFSPNLQSSVICSGKDSFLSGTFTAQPAVRRTSIATSEVKKSNLLENNSPFINIFKDSTNKSPHIHHNKYNRGTFTTCPSSSQLCS